MKIRYHHRTLADGAEGIHIAEMVDAFRRLGHDVRVLGVSPGKGSANTSGRLSRAKGISPRFLLEASPIALNAIDYLQVRAAIHDFRPALLYQRHARNDVGALLAGRHAGVPCVLEVNCLFTSDGYREFEPMALERAAVALERRALRLADVRIAVSTPLANQIAHLSGVKAVVIPNGANVRRRDPLLATPGAVRDRYGLGHSLVVGWTGVIREWHGLELLVEAVAQISDAHLLIVGDGPAHNASGTRTPSGYGAQAHGHRQNLSRRRAQSDRGDGYRGRCQ